MNDIQKTIGELAQKQLEQEELRVSEENREFFIKHAASAYTNVIVLAGYAGIFSIWSLLKSDLPSDVIAIVAILTMISLSIFVGFEVFKMVSTSVAAFKISEFIEEEMAADQINRGIKRYEKQLQLNMCRIIKIWPVTLVATLSTGYGAAGILIYYLVLSLLP